MKYEEKQIMTVLQLLETIEVSGTENMKKIIFIRQILDSPLKEEEQDGNK